MAKYTTTEIRDIMTTWVDSEKNTTGWMKGAVEDACANLDAGEITESVFSSSIQGMCRQLKENPLSRRGTNFSYDETREINLAECKTFTTTIETAFNKLSPVAQTYYPAKTSDQRTAGIYANGADLAGFMYERCEGEAKIQQKADKKSSKASAKGGNI